MMHLLIAFIWFASFAGWVWFLTDRQKLPAAMAPFGAICISVGGIYVGSLAGLLYPAALGLLAGGAALFIWMIIRRSCALLNIDLLLFVLGCAALYARYHSALLVVNDDFSHWGMMARHMLAHDRLPAAGDALIRFQSYPPATGCFLYYACRFLGVNDGLLISVQAWVTLAGLMPLFAFVTRKGQLIQRVAVISLVLIGLSLYHGTAALTVDNLVGVLSIGTMCLLLWAHCHDGHGQLYGAVALAVVALVKDSGLFFVICLVLLYALAGFEKGNVKRCFSRLLNVGAPALAARLAWYVHIKLAFPAADVSRHAMTLKNLRIMGSDKSYEDMFTIAKKLFGEAFSTHNMAVEVLLMMLGVCAVIILLHRVFAGEWRILRYAAVPVTAAAVYTAWTVMMALMYIFNMSITNAMNLTSYERYNGTCVLFLYGMLAVWLLITARKLPGWPAVFLSLVLLVPYAFGGMWTLGMPRLFEETYFVPLRGQMEVLSAMRQIRPGEKAAVVVEAGDVTSFAEYMARYAFQADDIRVIAADKAAQADAADLYFVASQTIPELPGNAEIIHLKDSGL